MHVFTSSKIKACLPRIHVVSGRIYCFAYWRTENCYLAAVQRVSNVHVHHTGRQDRQNNHPTLKWLNCCEPPSLPCKPQQKPIRAQDRDSAPVPFKAVETYVKGQHIRILTVKNKCCCATLKKPPAEILELWFIKTRGGHDTRWGHAQ